MARIIHTRKPTIPAIQPRKRVAAYARVSIEKESMIESLAAQIGYYRSHIQRNPEWQYIGVYADVDTSYGRNTKARQQSISRLYTGFGAVFWYQFLIRATPFFERTH